MLIYESVLRGISIHNKYLDWYCNLMRSALTRALSKDSAKSLLGYIEKHHIIPKSFKLLHINDTVYLTAKEHIVAHKLLTKFSVGDRLIAARRAYHCMCFKTNGGKNSRFPTLHQLADARKAASLANRGLRGIKGPPRWSNCSTSDEFKNMLISKIDAGTSDPLIGKEFNVSPTIIHIWKKKLNISNRREKLRDQTYLYDLYVVQFLSASEIANIIGCTTTAVQQYLKKFNIPIRTASIRQKNKHLSVDRRSNSNLG